MKNYIAIMFWFFSLVACQKSQTHPPQATPPKMMYTDFGDAVVKFNQHLTLDLDSNGTQDALFSSLMVGDHAFLGVAEKAGMNPSLVRQYASGVKYPSGEQAKKIQSAIKKIAEELIQDSIYVI